MPTHLFARWTNRHRAAPVALAEYPTVLMSAFNSSGAEVRLVRHDRVRNVPWGILWAVTVGSATVGTFLDEGEAVIAWETQRNR